MPFTKSYPIYDRFRLDVLWYGTIASNERTVEIAWDDRVTKVISAKVHGKIFTPYNSKSVIRLNDEDLILADGTFGDVTAEATVDVTGTLINGKNRFEAITWKIVLLPVGITSWFWTDLIVEYEGESPEVVPWWKQYALPIAVGVSVPLAIIGAVRLARRKK